MNNNNWTRKDLKWRAKEAFRKNYWAAVVVSLILAIVVASGGKGAAQSGADSVSSETSLYTDAYGTGSSFYGQMVKFMHSPLAVIIALVGASAIVTIALIGVILHLFVGNVLEVGARSFYVENLYSTPGIGKIFSPFTSGSYGNVVKTMFFRDLFVFLWSLLFIIPGIVKSYEYKMVPYLMAEYPDMDRKEAFAKSREMMYGNKWKAFVLDLSFIPWDILSGITIGIVGLFYVSPYKDATDAELYDTLASGMPGNGQQVYENGTY